jgi:hypothetical protein
MDLEGMLRECLISDGHERYGDEEANIVDGLFAIARALNRISDRLAELVDCQASAKMGDALDGLASLPNIAGAISDLKE